MTIDGGERTALWLVRGSGAALLALAVVLLVVMPSAVVHENVPGFTSPVIGFELASSPAHVFGILGAPADAERAETVRRMNLGNRIDFAFMVAYPLFYVGLALLLVARGVSPAWLAPLMAVLAVTMTFGDARENRQLLLLSSQVDPGAITATLPLLRIFTAVKWFAIFLASGLVAAGAWRPGSGLRWSAPFFALAALFGLAAPLWLPAVEYGSYAVAVAWLLAWVQSFRAR